jgi:hypothetical protein
MDTLATNFEECCILNKTAFASANKVVKEQLAACKTKPEHRCDVQMTP